MWTLLSFFQSFSSDKIARDFQLGKKKTKGEYRRQNSNSCKKSNLSNLKYFSFSKEKCQISLISVSLPSLPLNKLADNRWLWHGLPYPSSLGLGQEQTWRPYPEFLGKFPPQIRFCILSSRCSHLFPAQKVLCAWQTISSLSRARIFRYLKSQWFPQWPCHGKNVGLEIPWRNKQRKRTWSGEGGDASFANIPSFVIDFGYYRITNSPSPAGFPLVLPQSLKHKERQGLPREIMEKCRFSVNLAFSEYILCFNPLLCFCSLIASKFTFLFLKLQSPPKL